jgi:hypothetical protein
MLVLPARAAQQLKANPSPNLPLEPSKWAVIWHVHADTAKHCRDPGYVRRSKVNNAAAHPSVDNWLQEAYDTEGDPGCVGPPESDEAGGKA